MNRLFSWSIWQTLLLSLLALTAACSGQNDTPTTVSPTDQPTTTSPPSQPLAAAAETLVKTEPLTPEPIRITLDDLPEPYSTQSASQSPQVIPPPEDATFQVPEGFQVNIYAEGLNEPRWLALTPNGDVLVTETRENRILLLKDTNGDGAVDDRTVFADAQNGLDIPFGMAFAGNYFFLGNHNAVRRYPYTAGQAQIEGQGEKIADLPGGGYRQHWTRNVVASPNQDKIYVSIGSQSNVDAEPLPRASIQIMNLDGSGQETFAWGLRNPVGLDFHPDTGELYATVNERDGLGDDLVPDYFTRVRQGQFFGWPFAYLDPTLLDPRQTSNGKSNNPELATKTIAPDVLFQAHSAALGLQFYDGETFPQDYRQGAFVAFRGSWNRDRGTGYKIVYVPFNTQGQPEGYYEDFLTGFLVDPSVPTTWGRPVGLLVLPDGSLLLTEEANGRIYRVQYTGS